ncbi:MAG: electron transfer flavoprotein subunit beta/FixA family protein [Clostridiales bacterium]|nr:electron transfer flavoprotein subunit beta/FixA family protein [Clostridiales bacterium]
MKIIVCIKQVPATNKVEIDPENGTLKRMNIDSKTNGYDLYALETALCLREAAGGTVTAISMGPPQAEEALREAYMMGADDCALLCDREFAGADVLATSYTLSQGIRLLGGFDLILCGKQTTDGDTAQVGPALAEHLGIPHVSWARSLALTEKGLKVTHDLSVNTQLTVLSLPCLVTVDSGHCVPRLPSYLLMKETEGRPVRVLAHPDMPDTSPGSYGLDGSPTAVQRTFPPEVVRTRQMLEGDSATALYDILAKQKFIAGGG